MSRHRHIRTLKNDDLEHNDDSYGHSVEDDMSVSPNTMEHFMYSGDRGDPHLLASFIPEPKPAEMAFTQEDFPEQEPQDYAHAMDEDFPISNSQRRPVIPIQILPPKKSKPKKGKGASAQATPQQKSIAGDDLFIKPRQCNSPQGLIGRMQALGIDVEDSSSSDVDRPGSSASAAPAVNGSGTCNHADATLSIPSQSASVTGRLTPALSAASTRSASPAPPASVTDRSTLLKAYAQQKLESNGKETINLVVIGHVDAGKSTLMGNLLCQLGYVSDKQLAKYKWEAQKMGKASFAFAWVLDQTTEERSRGVTMDVAQTAFETQTKKVALMDAPGHKDFIPNMISGAVQADAALLVVNATRGEFETGLDSGGQTREHTRLVRVLGVSQLVVAVNKMDTVDWDEERFTGICKKLTTFFKTLNLGAVTYCPVSGLQGVNLVAGKGEAVSQLATWYTGPTLIDTIDALTAPQRPIDQPFRFSLSDLYKPPGCGTLAVSGRVEAGGVSSASNSATSRVLCMPANLPAVVKAIRATVSTVKGEEGSGVEGADAIVPYAFCGDQVSLVLSGVDPAQVLSPGSMLCDPNQPVPCTNRIRARLLVFALDQPITRGYPVVFHYQSMNMMATIGRLISVIYREGREDRTKQKPRCLTGNCTAEVELTLERVVCVELYQDYKALGKFTLRTGGQTIAGGTVTAILPQKKATKTEPL